MHSLRLRLMLFLGIAITVAAAALFLASFQAAMAEANKLFDYHMERMAVALQDNRFDQIENNSFRIGDNIRYDFVIQLWDNDGLQVFQSRHYRILPDKGKPGYATVSLDNGDWRIYTMKASSRVIQVAQKLETRRERAASLAWHALWPVIPVSLLLFVAAWWAVTVALAPLNRIGCELAVRTADSLDAVSSDGIPGEVSLLVAELNSLLERVRKTVQSHQRFIADAAHELRSPITALSLQVETALHAKDEGMRRIAANRLARGIERIAKLVEQLLALARHDPLADGSSQTRTSLLSCVDQALADMLPMATAKNIQLKYGAMSEADIWGNEGDLTIMVRNLIDNAVRYTPADGQIMIDVSTRAQHAVLVVQDSGPGIAPKDYERVFDRFYRVAGSGVEGNGLGLAIVKAIVNRYRGQVQMSRAAIGGLQATIEFPLLAPQASNSPLPSHSIPP